MNLASFERHLRLVLFTLSLTYKFRNTHYAMSTYLKSLTKGLSEFTTAPPVMRKLCKQPHYYQPAASPPTLYKSAQASLITAFSS